MKISRQQITGRGIAQQSGLDTFSSIINYTGEYVNFADALPYGVQLGSDTDYGSGTLDAALGALYGSPPNTINQWYRYHSENPAIYTNPGSASSADGFFKLPAITTGGLPSYCGMYQKLLLTTGKQYTVSVQTTRDTGIGTLYISIYTPTSGYSIISTASKTLPNTSGTLGLFESTFTALSSNDIIVIYATTTETSSQILSMTSISIQEKQEYLIPVYANDMWGNSHKVLRIAADQIVYTDET